MHMGGNRKHFVLITQYKAPKQQLKQNPKQKWNHGMQENGFAVLGTLALSFKWMNSDHASNTGQNFCLQWFSFNV